MIIKCPFVLETLEYFWVIIGFMYASRKRTVLTLPLVIAALIPIGLDGTIQLLTDYESTNPKAHYWLNCWSQTGVAIKIIVDSLDTIITTQFQYRNMDSLGFCQAPLYSMFCKAVLIVYSLVCKDTNNN